MSLILEALKKSDRQRRQQDGQVPKVRKQTLFLNRGHRRTYGLLSSALIVVVLAGLGYWMVLMFRSGPPNLVSGSASPAPEEKVLPVQAVDQPEAAKDVDVSTLPVPPIPQTSVAPPPPLPGRPAKTETRPSASAPDVPDRTAQQALETDADESPGPINVDVPSYADLSRELRSRLPWLKMSMHFYTDAPERRLARINDLLLHEGDRIDDDLEVVEIRPTGVVLNYQGMAFELRTTRQ